MQSDNILKWLSFGCLVITLPVMATATVFEKFYGNEFAREHIYVSLPVIILWSLVVFFSLIYILKRKLYRNPATFSLHISLVVILVGALTTHLSGKQGKLHLRMDEIPVMEFISEDSVPVSLPFKVKLKDFHPEYYPGTFSPADFKSTLIITDQGKEKENIVSMNNILSYRNFRFYQSGYDADMKGTLLSVSADPYGIAVTYTGYSLLLLSIIGFFFEKKTLFRQLLKSKDLKKLSLLLFFAGGSLSSFALPSVLPGKTADRFCDLYVYHNGRIASLHTLAKDFTLKIYGKKNYKGLTPEQVLTGWFFFYDDWKHEPMIKIKGKEITEKLGIDGNYARLTDFIDFRGYKLEQLMPEEGKTGRNAMEANEKFNLISQLSTGSLLKIYPFDPDDDTNLIWFSLADRPEEDMPYDQWLFIRGSMDLVAEKIMTKNYQGAESLLDKIKTYQQKEGGKFLPSEKRFKAEKFYSKYNYDAPVAMCCLSVGLIFFLWFTLSGALGYIIPLSLRCILFSLLVVLFLYLTLQITLRWYISNHIPLSNGFETMQFMAWFAALLSLLFEAKYKLLLPFSFLICGFALLVAMMGESSPQLTNLMPVLQSPLLSIHVMVIMTAYTLLAIAMLNGVSALIFTSIARDGEARIKYLMTISKIILYPSLFLLALGIFIGAVWANVSWGRYWGWDPKEVWALITFIIYALPLHSSSLSWFRRPLFFHLYSLFGFLSVIITYFGVNFFLGGMHAYA